MNPRNAAAIVSIWEQPDFIKYVIPVLQDREEALIAALVAKGPEDDLNRGGIRELRRFVGLHDLALSVLERENESQIRKNDVDSSVGL